MEVEGTWCERAGGKLGRNQGGGGGIGCVRWRVNSGRGSGIGGG